MSDTEKTETETLAANLQQAISTIHQLAQHHNGNSLNLLLILRALEHLHREIRDELFQDALPDNRQALYALLRNIEAEGGWPYIRRMKLQDILKKFEETLNPSLSSPAPQPSHSSDSDAITS